MSSVIHFQNVSHKFKNHTILNDVTLQIKDTEKVSIIGPAACGKSVLIKIACGLIVPDQGTVSLFDTPLNQCSETELTDLRKDIGMLFQSGALFDFMSTADNVAFPLRQQAILSEDIIAKKVSERLDAVGLGSSSALPISALSGGMQRRVGIARAGIALPKLVIYDEPSAGLDPVTTSKIYDLLSNDQKEHLNTVIVISSDIESLQKFTDRMIMPYHGDIIYDGSSDKIFDCKNPIVHQFIRGETQGPL